jgi:hypothetical protein
VTSNKEINSVEQELLNCATFLEFLADRLDEWARESREDGWSTHQVSKNKDAACACRDKAAFIRKFVEDHREVALVSGTRDIVSGDVLLSWGDGSQTTVKNDGIAEMPIPLTKLSAFILSGVKVEKFGSAAEPPARNAKAERDAAVLAAAQAEVNRFCAGRRTW